MVSRNLCCWLVFIGALLPAWTSLFQQPAIAYSDPFRSVLAASGWDEQRIAELGSTEVDEGTLGELLRLADSLRRFQQQLRADAAEHPAEDRQPLAPVALGVQVESVSLVSHPETGDYFLCNVTAGGEQLAVSSRRVPPAWREPGVLPQPGEVVGIRLNNDALIGVHWRWLPTKPSYPVVNFGETVLGSWGVDVAGLDRLSDGSRLLPQESEVFYAVLSATRNTGAHQLARFAKGNLETYARQWEAKSHDPVSTRLAQEVQRVVQEGRYPVAPLFNDAINQRGELYVLEGTARRAVLVEAAAAAQDPRGSVSREWGVERYYEIDLFTPDAYHLPVVFCTLEAPEGFPLGDKINVPVRVAGFSLKRWAYSTRQKTENGRDKPQLAPLLVGRSPILLPAPVHNKQPQQIAIGGGFVLALVFIVWVVWRTSRSDAEFERVAKLRTTENGEQFDPQRLAKLDGSVNKDD